MAVNVEPGDAEETTREDHDTVLAGSDANVDDMTEVASTDSDSGSGGNGR